ncbi:MAG: hypothetical protein ACO3LE_09650, partial [Bdellovibrionota bacterium]
ADLTTLKNWILNDITATEATRDAALLTSILPGTRDREMSLDIDALAATIQSLLTTYGTEGAALEAITANPQLSTQLTNLKSSVLNEVSSSESDRDAALLREAIRNTNIVSESMQAMADEKAAEFSALDARDNAFDAAIASVVIGGEEISDRLTGLRVDVNQINEEMKTDRDAALVPDGASDLSTGISNLNASVNTEEARLNAIVNSLNATIDSIGPTSENELSDRLTNLKTFILDEVSEGQGLRDAAQLDASINNSTIISTTIQSLSDNKLAEISALDGRASGFDDAIASVVINGEEISDRLTNLRVDVDQITDQMEADRVAALVPDADDDLSSSINTFNSTYTSAIADYDVEATRIDGIIANPQLENQLNTLKTFVLTEANETEASKVSYTLAYDSDHVSEELTSMRDATTAEISDIQNRDSSDQTIIDLRTTPADRSLSDLDSITDNPQLEIQLEFLKNQTLDFVTEIESKSLSAAITNPGETDSDEISSSLTSLGSAVNTAVDVATSSNFDEKSLAERISYLDNQINSPNQSLEAELQSLKDYTDSRVDQAEADMDVSAVTYLEEGASVPNPDATYPQPYSSSLTSTQLTQLVSETRAEIEDMISRDSQDASIIALRQTESSFNNLNDTISNPQLENQLQSLQTETNSFISEVEAKRLTYVLTDSGEYDVDEVSADITDW